MMEQRIYHGLVDQEALAQHLVDTWDQGDTAAQVLEGEEGLIVQIGQRSHGFFSDAPEGAVTLAIEPVAEGVRVTLGEQQWYRDGGGRVVVGGLIGFFPFFFTWPLGSGRDEPVDPQLAAEVWQTVEQFVARQNQAQEVSHPAARQGGAATGETIRLPGVACPSCGSANIPGAERCHACGTFLQARDCPQCGVSNPATANFCMRCGTSLREMRAVGQG
jgi:predicted RNA-binding Zn-ribbon protein involved in translation (DUF1610 family)